jgi:Spy/CpxP family protein refolding chaperone
MNRFLLKSGVWLVGNVWLLAAVPAWGQFAEPAAPPPRPKAAPATRPGGAPAAPANFLAVPGYWVLSMEGVQKEIGLTSEQKQKLKGVADQYQAAMRKKMEGLQDLSREEQQSRMEETARPLVQAAMKQVDAILTPEQLKSVQQTTFQLQAAQALAQPQVQEKLGLTTTQQRQLQSVYEQMREKMQQLQRDMAAKALEVLTPEQQQKLRQQAGGGTRN